MFEKLYRTLGQPRKHTIRHFDGVPGLGRVTWQCGCRVDYIDAHTYGYGAESGQTSMQLSPCDWHHEANSSGIVLMPAKVAAE
jgi:hypothetical protein